MQGFISDIKAIYRAQQHYQGSQSFKWLLRLKTVTRLRNLDFGVGALSREEIDWLIATIHQWLREFCDLQLDEIPCNDNRLLNINDGW